MSNLYGPTSRREELLGFRQSINNHQRQHLTDFTGFPLDPNVQMFPDHNDMRRFRRLRVPQAEFRQGPTHPGVLLEANYLALVAEGT